MVLRGNCFSSAGNTCTHAAPRTNGRGITRGAGSARGVGVVENSWTSSARGHGCGFRAAAPQSCLKHSARHRGRKHPRLGTLLVKAQKENKGQREQEKRRKGNQLLPCSDWFRCRALESPLLTTTQTRATDLVPSDASSGQGNS